jgi:DNA-directed RNA polymerase specialized sigma24 family protein
MNSGKRDSLPEHCHYRDEGCEFAPACLDCPLPRCIEEIPRGRQQWRKRLRNQEMLSLFARGMKTAQLAREFGVSQRTVQRVLKRAKLKN